MHLHPIGWLWPSVFVIDAAIVAAFLSGTEYGQAAIAVLVAVVGYMLNRKSNQIHVLVNQRMTDAMLQIKDQQIALVAQDHRIAMLESALGLEPGAHPPGV
jgi:hypothetical protein